MNRQEQAGLISKKVQLGVQFILYSAVGVITCVADFGLFVLFKDQMDCSSVTSFIWAFSLATLLNYYLCRGFVFRSNEKSYTQQVLRIFFVALVGLLISTLFFLGLEHYVSSYSLLNKLLTIPISMVWNFWARRRLVFSQQMPPAVLGKASDLLQKMQRKLNNP